MDTIWAVGHLESLDYHKAKYIIQVLVETHPDQFTATKPSEGLTEFQWTIRRNEIKETVTNNAERCISEEVISVAIFVNDHVTFTLSSLIKWASDSLLPELQNSLEQVNFHMLVKQAYNEFISNDKYVFVYMKIRLEDDKEMGTLVMQLFCDLCPKTVDNFRSLCTGEKFTQDNERICYAGSCIHRVVPNGWIQAGDIIDGSGSNGISIFGQAFPDESYAVSHNSAGIVGMANQGRNTNGSQFYITLKPSLWMDGQYVSFGRVIKGTEVLRQVEALNTYNERPMTSCYISECGVVKKS